MTDPVDPALAIGTDSEHWRRRLRPVAWAALEHLALAAYPDRHGWAALLGVRDVAKGIGVTKDTAARAVTKLRAAGLVTLEQLDGIDGHRRSGYRLHLPEGIQLRTCPTDQDSPPPPALTERCPTDAATDTCPGNQDSARAAESGARTPRPRQPGRRRLATTLAAQSTLFDPVTTAPAESTTDLSCVDLRSKVAIHNSHPREEVTPGA